MTEETIFVAALQQGTAAERAAYLEEVCAGDAALRERVEALLHSHFEGGSFLETPAVQRPAEELQAHDACGDTPGESSGGGEGESLDFLSPSGAGGSLGRLGHYEVLE